MTSSAPYPFASLSAESRTSAHRSDQDHIVNGTQPLRLTAFEPFSNGARESSEPDLRYTEEDLTKAVDAARQKASIETEAAMRKALADDVERRRGDLLAVMKSQFDQQRSMFELEVERLATDSQKLAFALVKAIIPRAIEKQPLADIADAIRSALHRLAAEPSVELRLPQDQADLGELLFAELIEQTGFAGEVSVAPDPSLNPGEAEFRWRAGVVDRSVNRLQSEALDLVDRWLGESSKDKSLTKDAPAQKDPPTITAFPHEERKRDVAMNEVPNEC